MLFSGAASAATINVNNSSANSIGNAISKAQAGDTLNLSAGTYKEKSLHIDKNLTITGPVTTWKPTVIIDVNKKGRVFQVNSGVQLNLKYILIENGYTTHNGGGVLNMGILNVNICKFYNNTADMNGGGIANIGGKVKIITSYVVLNKALQNGGGIYNLKGDLTIFDSYIESNKAYRGGGICNYGNLKLNGCYFITNKATYGGAIDNHSNFNVTDCGLSSNSANLGKEIYNTGGNTSNRIVNYNRIDDDKGHPICCESGSVNAEYNYWGNDYSPKNKVIGNVDYTPWIKDVPGEPYFVSSSPANGATNVAASKTITVTYNEYVTKAAFFRFVLKNSDGAIIPITKYIKGKVVYINPVNNLKKSRYTLIIHSESVMDMVGNYCKYKEIKFSV